ncbi:MAG: phosphoribosylaminoimidazolesuccinocarboxamide synthase, partial [Rhodopirellula sp. JB053]
DTKFEFGLVDGELILVDEVLTPDSSRFWAADEYEPGQAQRSFDKQFVREWLHASDWDRDSVPPPLTKEIVEKTTERYREGAKRLRGEW